MEIRCPIWAFVEIISFGTFINLFDYYYGENSPVKKQQLNPIKSLRNACTHNNCLINNLRRGSTKPARSVSQFIASILNISSGTRKKFLSSQVIFEFCTLLIVYDSNVSESIKEHRYCELYNLLNQRVVEHSDYYTDQQLLRSAYYFIKKVTDFLIK